MPRSQIEKDQFLPDETRDQPPADAVPSEAAVREVLTQEDDVLRAEIASEARCGGDAVVVRRRRADDADPLSVDVETAQWEAILPAGIADKDSLQKWCADSWFTVTQTDAFDTLPEPLSDTESVLVVRRDPPTWVAPNTPSEAPAGAYTCANCFDDPHDPLQQNPFAGVDTGITPTRHQYLILECSNCQHAGVTGADGAWRTGAVQVPWVHTLPPHLRA